MAGLSRLHLFRKSAPHGRTELRFLGSDSVDLRLNLIRARSGFEDTPESQTLGYGVLVSRERRIVHAFCSNNQLPGRCTRSRASTRNESCALHCREINAVRHALARRVVAVVVFDIPMKSKAFLRKDRANSGLVLQLRVG